MAYIDRLVPKVSLIIVGGSECVVLKRPFVDISYHLEWTRPFRAGAATFGS
jgi:hypothetical protein